MATVYDSSKYCCVSAVPFILDRQQNMRFFQFMFPLDWTLDTWRLRNFICKSDEMHGNICVSSYINFFVRFCIGAKSHILQSSYIYYSQKVLACIDGLLFSGYTHKLNLSWIPSWWLGGSNSIFMCFNRKWNWNFLGYPLHSDYSFLQILHISDIIGVTCFKFIWYTAWLFPHFIRYPHLG